MAASIPHRYLRMATFPSLVSLCFGPAAILEANAGLIDLRAEWFRGRDLEVAVDAGTPEAQDFYLDDSDGDGLADDDEALYDCDPYQADSDRDGLTDGQEVRQFGTDPRSTAPDQDRDGTTDYAESVFSPINSRYVLA